MSRGSSGSRPSHCDRVGMGPIYLIHLWSSELYLTNYFFQKKLCCRVGNGISSHGLDLCPCLSRETGLAFTQLDQPCGMN